METVLRQLLDGGTVPTFEAVRELVHTSQPVAVPQLCAAPLDFGIYDRLLPSQGASSQPVTQREVAQ